MEHKSSRDKRKHRHSRHSKHDDSSSEDSLSSSDYDSESDDSESYSESSSSSSEEEKRRKERKRVRRSSELGEKKHKKMKKKLKKPKKSSSGGRKKSKKSSKMDIEEISMDDYFLKSAEFRTWLSKERGKFFSDLSSEEARKFFGKFVSRWNSGDLDKAYYGGIQSSAVGHDSQSNYQWQFASGVKSTDLKTVRDSVSAWSSSKSNFDLANAAESSSSRAKVPASNPDFGPPQPSHSKSSATRMIGPSRGPTGQSDAGSEDVFAREERRERERDHLKKDRKEFRKKQELVMDELLPKASGPKEARMEKKKMRAQMRKEREMSPEDNSKVYGKTTNTIRDQVKARQQHRQNRAHAAVQKISDYQAREKAKAEAILQMARANKKEGALW